MLQVLTIVLAIAFSISNVPQPSAAADPPETQPPCGQVVCAGG